MGRALSEKRQPDSIPNPRSFQAAPGLKKHIHHAVSSRTTAGTVAFPRENPGRRGRSASRQIQSDHNAYKVNLFQLTLLLPVFISSLMLLSALAAGAFDNGILATGPASVAFANEDIQPSEAVVVMKASLDSISAGSGYRELVFTRHRVARKETVSRIAYEYGLSPSTLISVNRMDTSELAEIAVGTNLIVPYRDGFRVTPEVGEGPMELAARYGTASDLVQQIPGTGDFFISGAGVQEIPTDPVGGNTFRYPVVGRIVTAYGTGMDSLTGISYDSEGIDLAAEIGTPVKVAREGTVIFTGHHGSYGMYVMVSHPAGWKSFYGHLSRIDVVPGDNLNVSDVLGTVGDSGTARSPRLHFALFNNGEPVDPLDYLY